MNHEIIITDVTCYGSLYCVAGWDPNAGTMIRPEPSTTNSMNEASRFWPEQYVGAGKFFAVGNVVRINSAEPQPASEFPHGHEDRVLAPNSIIQVVGTLAGAELLERIQGSVRPTIAAAFGHQLVRAGNGKCHVVATANAPSLSAVELASGSIQFYVDDYRPDKPKLRARVNEAGIPYDLSVPAAAARFSWKDHGLQAMQDEIRQTASVHVRVGLCRAFGGKCYAQINGIIPV